MTDTITDPQTKPSYLGLLNAIAVAEGHAEEYLNCWADMSPSDEVRGVLRTIALREGEHSKAFAKRISELGFDVIDREPDEKPIEIAMSTTMSDREKFEALGLGREPSDKPDVFAGMFENTDIDIQTGGLLGRYIAEERDSGRLFRDCYRQLCEADNGGAGGTAVRELNDRLDRIESAIEQLVTSNGSANGSGRSKARSGSSSKSGSSKSKSKKSK